MTDETTARGITRRDLLKTAGIGALALATGGTAATLAKRSLASHISAATALKRRFAASDGFVSLPGRPAPNDLFVFGFSEVPLTASTAQAVNLAKGKTQWPSPILSMKEDVGLELRLTNVGFQYRGDLDDSHTVHWHGFRNAIAIDDGTPELSIAVPVNRTFPYFYAPRDPGTYIYHCHFEDSEHVQMGMTGIVFVRPAANDKWAYADTSTAFDRQVSLLLNEVDVRPHDLLLAVQEFVWSDYRPQYWIINGRAYPDTVAPSLGDVPAVDYPAHLKAQPVSSLVQANPGDTVLLRLANLGYEQHALVLPGIPMRVVGEDATLLRGPLGADLSYTTSTVYIGPGETRDVLLETPAFDPGAVAGTTPTRGPWNTYYLKNRNYDRQTNGGLPGLGGMVTEVRVYQDPLPAQGVGDLNKTYV